MNAAPRVVDVHAHYIAPSLVEEVERHGATYGARVDKGPGGQDIMRFVDQPAPPPMPRELCDLDGRSRRLDADGVDVQIISSWGELTGYHLPAAQGAAWARLQNETLADAARAKGSRFAAMGSLPMQDVKRTLEEMRFGVEHLGMRSFMICTNVNGRDLDDPELRPFWKMACDLDVLIFLHPPVHHALSPRLEEYFLTNLVGVPTETTIAAARLIFSGVLQELPGLKILLGHGGGMLPYQIGRFDRGFVASPAVSVHLRRKPSEFLGSFYYDTVLFDERALSYLFRMVPSDHILLGTDFPFPIRDDDMLPRLRRVPGIDPESMTGVLGGNAVRLLLGGARANEASRADGSSSERSDQTA